MMDLISEAYNEDCYDTLKRIPDGKINLLLQDTPFEVTQNSWDIKPDLAKMWPEWMRVGAPNAAFIFFATQPFASELIMSNLKMFRYDLIWEKDRATGFLNADKMPLRAHESILVFYRKLPTYNPQKTFGHKPSNASKNNFGSSANYGDYTKKDTGGNTDRYPRSILYTNVVNVAHKPIHPTQKPIPLIRNLVATYSNPLDFVYDGYLGSGTTRNAAWLEGRHFIGAESDKEYGYFEKQERSFELIRQQQSLFQ